MHGTYAWGECVISVDKDKVGSGAERERKYNVMLENLLNT
jgi:hypothetical protein